MTLPLDAPDRPASETVASIELDLTGMTCGACAGRIERSLNRREGVVVAGVNFATARARVAFDPARTSPEDLTALVADLGYGASPVASDSGLAPAPVPGEPGPPDWWLRAAVAWPLTFLLLTLPWFRSGRAGQTGALVVSVPVLFGSGWPFLRGAAISARHRTATMDTLVSTAILAAFASAVWHLGVGVPGGHLHHAGVDGHVLDHLRAVTVVVAALVVGRGLEARARRRPFPPSHGCSPWPPRRLRSSSETRRSSSPSRACGSVTSCGCGRERRSPWTASWWPGPPPSTSRCSPVSPSRSRRRRAIPWSGRP